MERRRGLAVLLVVAMMAAGLGWSSVGATPPLLPTCFDIPSTGGPAVTALTPDGRFFAYSSTGGDEPPGPLATLQVFVHDRYRDVAELVSGTSDGSAQANDDATVAGISDDGDLVAFISDATNLGAPSGGGQLYVHERSTGDTRLVSVSDDESAVANSRVIDARMTGKGRYIAFSTEATNLVPGAPSGVTQIYLRDLEGGSTVLVTADSGGGPADGDSHLAAITPDGMHVLFDSRATDLTALDTDPCRDVYVRVVDGAVTDLISVASTGLSGSNDDSLARDLTPNGRFVLFDSEATNLDAFGVPNAFVRDRLGALTRPVGIDRTGGAPNARVVADEISDLGDMVSFWSEATDLHLGASSGVGQVFVRDLVEDATLLLSVRSSGFAANDWTMPVALRDDAVFFTSDASNLHDDPVAAPQLYRAPIPPPPSLTSAGAELVSRDGPSGAVCNDSCYDAFPTTVSEDGRGVFFVGAATNLTPITTGLQYGNLGFFHHLDSSFPDVPVAHNFWGQISWMAEYEITGGFPDGTFGPELPVSRAGMAAFMQRLFEAAGGTIEAFPDPGFPDVPPTHPFYDEIRWMAGTGITGGFSDGTFRPGAPVARQGMAAFMQRLFVELDGTVEAFPDPGFSDVPPGHGFVDEIRWMAGTGITGGFPDGTFRPTATVSRQGMAAFMFRLWELLVAAG
jgi:hypothetical protein